MEITPVPAATLILARVGARGIEVLMGKRTETRGIFGQAHVFPGGVVEESDHTFSQPQQFLPHDLAYRVAALRETAEEVGLWLTVNPSLAEDAVFVNADNTQYGAGTSDKNSTQQLEAIPPSGNIPPEGLHPGDTSSEVLIREKAVQDRSPSTTQLGELRTSEEGRNRKTRDVSLENHTDPQPEWAVSSLSYISTWVTPPGLPRRYHTKFYLTEGNRLPPPSPTGTELTDTVWVTPEQAIRNGEENLWIVHPPTYHHLRWIGGFTNLDHLLETTRENDRELVPQAELDTYPI